RSRATFPSSTRRGGCALIKCREATTAGQTGWSRLPKVSSMLDHPVRSTSEASRHFVYVAATPPRGGGECRSTPIRSPLHRPPLETGVHRCCPASQCPAPRVPLPKEKWYRSSGKPKDGATKANEGTPEHAESVARRNFRRLARARTGGRTRVAYRH